MNIEVTQTAPMNLEVQESPGLSVVTVTPSQEVEIGIALPQQNVFVGEVQPLFAGPGVWIQTGLGNDGTGFTFWFEDGAT